MTNVETSSSGLPKCPCGFDKNHGLVSKRPHYSVAGMLMVLWAGAGARPKRIDYVCPRCGTVIDTCTDRVELRKFH